MKKQTKFDIIMMYFLRVITLPFYLGLIGVGLVVLFFKHSYRWITHGGEAVAYIDNNQRKNIFEVYQLLEKDMKDKMPDIKPKP